MFEAGIAPPSADEIEGYALRGWPAETVEELAGWRLRAMGGVTRRANSAWTGAAHGALTLEQRIETLEAFYAKHGLPSLVQVSTASRPDGLDEFLAQRGYELDAPVSVQVAAPARVAAEGRHPITLLKEPSAEWLDVSVRQGRYHAAEAAYCGLLTRLGERATFALARVDGEPAAVGLGIADGRALSLCSMLTLNRFRSRGLASAIVQTLARHALESGKELLYLQVEADNRIARALYERHGFAELYRSHYRLAARR